MSELIHTPEALGNVAISGQNLIKSYGKIKAMRGISLNVQRGEILAIMGPSGSGKSTLLHAMAGIELPDSGSVMYAGKNLTKLSDAKRTVLRRSDFGFVFQFSQLVPELTAIDNVAVPLLLNGMKRAEAYEIAAHWVDKVALGSHKNALPGQLSGGEAQRIAVARALCIKPTILFADEPTGSLDSLNSERVMEMFIHLARENKMTMLIVTHEPAIAAYADREVFVRDGLLEV